VNVKPTGTPIFVQFELHHAGKGIYPSRPAWMTPLSSRLPGSKPVARNAQKATVPVQHAGLFDDAWLIAGA
jgi:hypothetical protein